MIKEFKEWTIVSIGEFKTDFLPISELSGLQTKPLDLLQFYKDFGRGTFCDLFNFGPLTPTKTLNLLAEMVDNYPIEEGRTFGVVDTAQGVLILYTEKGNYYVIDCNDEKAYKQNSLKNSLITAADLIDFKEVFTTPYYWTASVVCEVYNAHVNRETIWREAKSLKGFTIIKRANYLGKYFSVIENEQKWQADLFFGTDNKFEKLTMVFDTKDYQLEDRKRLLSTLNDLSKGTLYVDGL